MHGDKPLMQQYCVMQLPGEAMTTMRIVFNMPITLCALSIMHFAMLQYFCCTADYTSLSLMLDW